MKILKIELQNLNSLKSETPTVIDFENEEFKDVGLYAITGPTGAGKTTILDAITIALYQEVPRFKGNKHTNVLDVVSHGATDAFSRVTFENNNTVYEAFWHARLAHPNTGRIYAHPQEEVYLKNITTEKTIADQKRTVKAGVEEVTQLDYKQFLRSVMLAQGDFASFLTAKGSEKGRLLEQITGEEIYKKIGQGISDRRATESHKLDQIKSKINDDDILTEEERIEIIKESKEIEAKIESLNKKLKAIEVIVNWYEKEKELLNTSETLEGKEKALEETAKQHKAAFELLDLNEKAEPFKELIQNINRNEKSKAEKTTLFKKLEEELKVLAPKIEQLNESTEQQSKTLVKAEQEFENWQPKFDTVTKLDGQLKNEAENQEQAKAKLAEVKKALELLEEEKKEFIRLSTETEEKINRDEEFVNKNNFLTKVDAEISTWSAELTTLKSNKEALNEQQNTLKDKTEILKTTSVELKTNTDKLSAKTAEIEKIEKEIKEIDEQLSKNSLSDLLDKQTKFSELHSNWKKLQSFSEEFTKKEEEVKKKSDEKKSLSAELEKVNKEIAENKKQVDIQEKLVADAQTILDLERIKAKYEEDRKKLEADEPCFLCGSKEHPFVDEHVTAGVSKSESEVNNRKEKLKSLEVSQSELEKAEVKISNSIENLTKQIEGLNQELKSIQSKAIALEIDVELSNLQKIQIEINQAEKQLIELTAKIKSTQELQAQKDKLSASLNAQNQSIDGLKNTAARQEEQVKNLKTELKIIDKKIEESTKTCTDLEDELKAKLSQFNYEIPSIEKTNDFIEEIKNSIIQFNKTEKNLDQLKGDLRVFKNNLKDLKKQEKGHDKSAKEHRKTLTESQKEAENLKNKRIAILPLEVSVEQKRETLQANLKALDKKVEESKKELQKKRDEENELKTRKSENEKEQQRLEQELNELNIKLETQLEPSSFNSKLEIEKALLPHADKVKYQEHRDDLKEKQAQLKGQKEANVKALEAHKKAKNFETTEEESQQELQEINNEKDEAAARKGEIKETFRKDQEIKDRNKEVVKEIKAQEEVCNVWNNLFELIGGSKDAFNVYVQRLTLEHLLSLANAHLSHLNKRYSLKMKPDYSKGQELNFHLIDHYQIDQARKVETSSGGEKFIISLALALGLSDLASKNVKIDSLFIDEGFGTLDKNTLETVISTLETLQSQGKMIGIISHVENLKERIPTQIMIEKKSNGVSEVNFTG